MIIIILVTPVSSTFHSQEVWESKISPSCVSHLLSLQSSRRSSCSFKKRCGVVKTLQLRITAKTRKKPKTFIEVMEAGIVRNLLLGCFTLIIISSKMSASEYLFNTTPDFLSIALNKLLLFVTTDTSLTSVCKVGQKKDT